MGQPILHIDDHRATITLDRADKRNRIEPDDIAALVDHYATIDANDDIRVVVLTGTGTVFCSGYHLGALAEGERPKHGFQEACDGFQALRVPTIAALQGGVYGGGTDLAVSADFRVATTECRLRMPAAMIGIHYYATGLERFVQRIGPNATKRLFLTAETLDAPELVRIGYLDEIHPEDRFATRVDELADAIAGLAPLAVQGMRATIDAFAAGDVDLAAHQAAADASMRTNDHREGLAALAEKRPPNFTGT